MISQPINNYKIKGYERGRLMVLLEMWEEFRNANDQGVFSICMEKKSINRGYSAKIKMI